MDDPPTDKPWHKHRDLVIGILLACGAAIMTIMLLLLPVDNKARVVLLVFMFLLLAFSVALILHYLDRLCLGIALGITFSAISTVGFGWYVWPDKSPTPTPDVKIAVYPPFRSAYEKHKTQLGEPIFKEQSAGPQPIEYVHQKAIVFWSEHLGFYKLRDDGYCEFEDDLVWREAETLGWDNKMWNNDEELNKLFPDCN